MARASRKVAQKHREEIVEAASRLFRARGLGGVSVPELMAAAGLTHGGFYGHFASKDALAAIALASAFEEIDARIDEAGTAAGGTRAAAWDAVVDSYLSAAHRDHPEAGCPTAALVDVGRDGVCDTVRTAYVEGVGGLLARLEAQQPPGEAAHEAALAALSTFVGALLLSRATRGTPLSEEFLDAARRHLKAAGGAAPPAAAPEAG